MIPQFAVLDGGLATELVRQGFSDIDVSCYEIISNKIKFDTCILLRTSKNVKAKGMVEI